MKKIDESSPETFSFDLTGNGVNVFAGSFKAIDIERALAMARKCVRQTLPGYSLVCKETGDAFPAVKFFDRDVSSGNLLKPIAKYR